MLHWLVLQRWQSWRSTKVPQILHLTLSQQPHDNCQQNWKSEEPIENRCFPYSLDRQATLLLLCTNKKHDNFEKKNVLMFVCQLIWKIIIARFSFTRSTHQHSAVHLARRMGLLDCSDLTMLLGIIPISENTSWMVVINTFSLKKKVLMQKICSRMFLYYC